MSKKMWMKPQTSVQEFEANDAISACIVEGVFSGRVYFETNGREGIQEYGWNDPNPSQSYAADVGVNFVYTDTDSYPLSGVTLVTGYISDGTTFVPDTSAYYYNRPGTRTYWRSTRPIEEVARS